MIGKLKASSTFIFKLLCFEKRYKESHNTNIGKTYFQKVSSQLLFYPARQNYQIALNWVYERKINTELFSLK